MLILVLLPRSDVFFDRAPGGEFLSRGAKAAEHKQNKKEVLGHT
jgi:hypothetical protein